MTDAADRYRRLAGRFTEVVSAVPDSSWDSASPCEGWSTRQVLDHVTDSECGFLGRFDRAPDLEGVEVPLDRWTRVRDAMQGALDDPEVAGATYEGHFGQTTLAETVDGFLSPDLVIHAWDVARGAGLVRLETMAPEEVERLDTRFRAMGDAIRSPGAFGPEVEVPADAPAQDRLLAFLGRRP